MSNKKEPVKIKAKKLKILKKNNNAITDSDVLYVSELIKLIKGDSLSKLDSIADKSIQLICIDPPYNIGKDTWDTIDNYNDFMIEIIKKLETKLKDNGSFFMFHNNMETISELMVSIKKNTKCIFCLLYSSPSPRD